MKSAGRYRIRRSSSSRAYTALVLSVVLLSGGIVLLLMDLDVGQWYNSIKENEAAKAGKFIMTHRPKQQSPPSVAEPGPKSSPRSSDDLTFYQTLTQDEGQDLLIPPHSPLAEKARSSGTDNGSSTKRYTLQVGSFVERDTARRLVDKLGGKGYPAYLTQAVFPDQQVRYRVRVGSFSSKIQAKTLAERLEKQEGLKAFVTFSDETSQ